MFGEVGTQIFILKKINSFRKHGTHENEQLIRSREKKKKAIFYLIQIQRHQDIFCLNKTDP